MAEGDRYDTGLDKNPANYVPLSPLGFLERAAAVYPDRAAVVYGDQSYDWREAYARARRLASTLAEPGRHRPHGRDAMVAAVAGAGRGSPRMAARRARAVEADLCPVRRGAHHGVASVVGGAREDCRTAQWRGGVPARRIERATVYKITEITTDFWKWRGQLSGQEGNRLARAAKVSA